MKFFWSNSSVIASAVGGFVKIISCLIYVSLMAMPAWSWANRYGFDGRDGRKGEKGVDGANGRDVEMLVTNKPVQLDLSGQDGGRAKSDGENGQDATGCMSYPRDPEYDLMGADGGDGGHGGNGGDGGRGGDITLLYQDKNLLKNITVISRGGRGGEGSQPGQGGWGCRCIQRSWTVRRCYRDSNNMEHCSYRTYMCQDGRNGYRGYKGVPGMPGELGRLTLVKGAMLPPPEVLQAENTLSELVSRPTILGENTWSSDVGALSLLGPGSLIDDRYLDFVAHSTHKVLLDWRPKRSLQEFADMKVKIELHDGDVKMILPEDVWSTVERIVDGKIVTFRFHEIVKKAEVRDVKFELSGRGSETVLTLRQAGLFTDVLQNSLHMQVWLDKTLGDKDVFNQEIPSDLLRVSGSDLVLDIGSMKMKEKNVFKSKRKIKWRAVLKRTMGEHSLQIDSGLQKHTVSGR